MSSSAIFPDKPDGEYFHNFLRTTYLTTTRRIFSPGCRPGVQQIMHNYPYCNTFVILLSPTRSSLELAADDSNFLVTKSGKLNVVVKRNQNHPRTF